MENQTFTLEDAARPYNIRHRCFHFSKEVIHFVGNCKYDRIHFSIFDQLLRSATSIGANVVEGNSGGSKKEFSNFFRIALKSANESKYWFCLIRDTMDVDQIKLKELLLEADELSKIISSILIAAAR